MEEGVCVGGVRDRKKKGKRKESWVGEGRRECCKKEEEGKCVCGGGVRHKKGCCKRDRKNKREKRKRQAEVVGRGWG